MRDANVPQQAATHNWERAVDGEHLTRIRQDPATFAPGGVSHLVLEVLAYAADEAESAPGGRCVLTRCADGSVSVADNGRGTEVRRDESGRPVRKPVMATKDLRFFDAPHGQCLPDGYRRWGASSVTALSAWLVHTSSRPDGAWIQRYEHGRPVTGLRSLPATGQTGTVVHFLADPSLVGPAPLVLPTLAGLIRAAWPQLNIHVVDEFPQPPGACATA
jgi:topoisomerase IV subunit B